MSKEAKVESKLVCDKCKQTAIMMIANRKEKWIRCKSCHPFFLMGLCNWGGNVAIVKKFDPEGIEYAEDDEIDEFAADQLNGTDEHDSDAAASDRYRASLEDEPDE